MDTYGVSIGAEIVRYDEAGNMHIFEVCAGCVEAQREDAACFESDGPAKSCWHLDDHMKRTHF
jgi:hypothetical protein